MEKFLHSSISGSSNLDIDLDSLFDMKHFPSHEKDNQNLCASTGGEFSTEDSLENQISSDHEKTKFYKCIRWPYKCAVCDSSVSQEKYIQPQIISVHEDERPFKCSVCDTSFYEKGKLERHIVAVDEKKKPYICFVCNSAFSRNSQLIGHLASVHEGKKPYDCII